VNKEKVLFVCVHNSARSQMAEAFLKQGRMFHYVITVCDETSGERCPIFPGISMRLHWSFEDPSSFTGSYEEKLSRTRTVRDAIKARVDQFVEETLNSSPAK